MKWDSSREMTRDVLDRSKGQTMTVNRIISIRTGIRFERQLNPETHLITVVCAVCLNTIREHIYYPKYTTNVCTIYCYFHIF